MHTSACKAATTNIMHTGTRKALWYCCAVKCVRKYYDVKGNICNLYAYQR
jgi:hypothetical protein